MSQSVRPSFITLLPLPWVKRGRHWTPSEARGVAGLALQNLRCLLKSGFSFRSASRVAEFKETVWQEFSPLANKHGAVNLGQGFPNWNPAQSALQAAVSVMDPAKPASEIAPLNQYARSGGHMPLVNALIDLYSEPLKQKLDPSNVLVTGGASEALFAAGQAFLDPGDEVILFEPFFDIYGGALSFAGAKIVPVQLHLRKPAKTDPNGPEPELSSSMYQFNFDELSAAFNDKTKMIWINTPHNPTGKMFSVAELEQIASLVRKYPRVIVLSDEVYEWITFDGQVHNRFANLADMWERTLTVSSAAKTFSITGWKVGWALGPAPLIAACSRAHEYIIYCIATPLQESVAKAIRDAMAGTYFEELRQSYSRKRQIVVDALRAAGLNPIIPQGAFYVTVDVSHIELAPSDGLETLTGIQMDRKDWKIARWLTAIVGVTPIPCSAFYVPEHMDNASILRFAFCKTEELLHEAAKRFAKLPQHLQQSQQKRLQELQQ